MVGALLPFCEQRGSVPIAKSPKLSALAGTLSHHLQPIDPASCIRWFALFEEPILRDGGQTASNASGIKVPESPRNGMASKWLTVNSKKPGTVSRIPPSHSGPGTSFCRVEVQVSASDIWGQRNGESPWGSPNVHVVHAQLSRSGELAGRTGTA